MFVLGSTCNFTVLLTQWGRMGAAAQNANWPEFPALLKDVEQVDCRAGIVHGCLWAGLSLTVASLQWCGHLFSLLCYQSLVWNWLKNLFHLLLSTLLSLLTAVLSQGGLGFLPWGMQHSKKRQMSVASLAFGIKYTHALKIGFLLLLQWNELIQSHIWPTLTWHRGVIYWNQKCISVRCCST